MVCPAGGDDLKEGMQSEIDIVLLSKINGEAPFAPWDRTESVYQRTVLECIRRKADRLVVS